MKTYNQVNRNTKMLIPGCSIIFSQITNVILQCSFHFFHFLIDASMISYKVVLTMKK